MNVSSNRLDGFEQRLLVALKDEIGNVAAPARSPDSPRRRLAVAGVTVAAATAVGIAVPLALSDHSAANAYAVTKEANGSITVQIYRLADSAGLEQALRADGIRSDITYTPVGTMCRQGRYVRSKVGWGPSSLDISHGLKFTFYPPIPTTGTWVMEYSGSQATPRGPLVGDHDGFGVVFSGRFGTAQGPVAPCVLTTAR